MNSTDIFSRVQCPQRQTCFWILFTDLEDIFQQAGIGRNSPGLTYDGLSKVFGTSTPSARTMECFDNGGDRRYSLMELKAAVGLWAHYHWQQWTVLNTQRGLGVRSSRPFSVIAALLWTEYLSYWLWNSGAGMPPTHSSLPGPFQHNLVHETYAYILKLIHTSTCMQNIQLLF